MGLSNEGRPANRAMQLSNQEASGEKRNPSHLKRVLVGKVSSGFVEHSLEDSAQLCVEHSLEFCWVLSVTLILALGLRLLDSSSSAGTSPTRVTVGRAARLLAGAAPQSTPSLQRAGTQVNCDPQLVSLSLAARVQ